MKWKRIQELRKELKAERIDMVELAEIERAFNRIPQKELSDLKANAMASDMLDVLEARAKKPKEKWEEIADHAVRSVWHCEVEDCGHEEVVSPTSLAESGTPQCPHCDQDLTYIRTEINTNR